MFQFTITSRHGNARTGVLSTPHGNVETPAFIFCATKAALKCTTPDMIYAANTQIILANTYHLMINNGSQIMRKCGGIHNFMGWKGPILTDSGGFQIFSLGHGSVADEIKRKQMHNKKKSLLRITEDGAIFKSYIDGSQHFLTPEKAMEIQNDIGSDIVLPLDECTPFHVDKTYTEKSMLMSHTWESRSNAAFKQLQKNSPHQQALYGIVQGGVYEDLREISADFINQQDFFGIAIGGSLGHTKQQMRDITSYTCGLLNDSKPKHLLGIGTISDILEMVRSGIDTFDCVHPTRIARHGTAISAKNPEHGINLRNTGFKEDFAPIDNLCHCYTCKNFSKAYIHYLLRIREPLAMTLLTIHNIQQMNDLMLDIRNGIAIGTLTDVYNKWLKSDTLIHC